MNPHDMFTRQQLFDLVWSQPLSKLALKYDISDRGLAKLCNRLKVPLPDQGFWLRDGRESEPKPALPALKGPQDPTVLELRTQPEPEDPRIGVWRDRESLEENRVTVAPITRAHPLIAAVRNSKKSERTEEKGLLRFRRKGAFDIRVTEASLERAATIANALVLALEKRGLPVGTNTPENYWTPPKTFVTVFGHEVAIRIQERLKQVKNPVKGGLYDRSILLSATGRLTVQIDEYAVDVKRVWEDTAERLVEDCLNEVIVSIVAVGVRKDLIAQAEAKRQEEVRNAQQRAAEEAERKRLEQLKRLCLKRQVQRWLSGHDLAAFASAGRLLLEEEDIPDDKRKRLLEWFDWAEKHSLALVEQALLEGPPVGGAPEADDDEAASILYFRSEPASDRPKKRWHPNLRWFHNR